MRSVVSGARSTKLPKQTGHLIQWDGIIDVDVTRGVCRHGRVHGVLHVLHDSGATHLFKGPQAGCAVIEITGKNDADRRRTIHLGRGAEEGNHRRPEAVLPGTLGDTQTPGLDEQVMIGRGDVDGAGLQPLTIDGWTAGIFPARVRMAGTIPGESGATCSTMHTGTGKSAGMARTSSRSASIPPAEVPMTTRRLAF